MSQSTERALIAAIVAAFTLLGLVYSVVTPIFEASDEKWHYPMVKTIADNWSLPVQEPDVDTPWRQEGSQAPLYYALSAAATFWIDTSDMEAVRHLNPHVDAGATPDGNGNLVVHDPALERFPWRGTALAVHIIRFLSVLMGAAAVIFTYLIAREVLPARPALALGAAAIHAFTPMVVFISASVNNDNLAVLLSSLGLWLLIRISNLQSPNLKSSMTRYLPLGVVLGLAALTKSQTLALAPLTALVVAMRAARRRSWREFVIGGLATALPLLLIAGWWYLRNLRLYGDLSGIEMFTQILGQRDVPADLPQLWRERFSFLVGYWGNFGGINVPMAAWVYGVLNTIVPVAAVGLLIALVKTQIANRKSQKPSVRHLIFAICNLPLVLCLLWALLVFIPWLLWARVTWSSQGRLVFYAISVWSLLLAMGIAGWLPRRWGRWAVAAFALFLLGLAAAAPFAWIAPAYAPPEPLTDAQVAAIPNPLSVTFGPLTSMGRANNLKLLGYDLETTAVEPGGQVAVTLYWQALAPTERPYSVFVHLLGEGDILIAQRDTYPGLGLLSTTRLTAWLGPGSAWADRYVIRVPETAYAPDVAQIAVGLYNYADWTRLPAGNGAASSGDHVRFGRIEIQALQGEVPNPIAVNFDDQMALVGYDLDRRVVRPGEEITLTLYWRGLRKMARNYTISAQLVNDAQVKAAEDSNWPLKGDAPTMLWEPGNLLEDPKTLAVRADALPGVYDVQITVFKKQDEEFIHLPVISERGEMLSNHVLLTQVRVEP
ncbi:MAG: glycosyltransferase family 39 protein [Anaerolineae bacterium]|nr:glycosyltransferase family 39 protein [Anaerolineae bacterium]